MAFAEAPLRILELGCGSGRLLVPLVRDGHAVCGVDRSAPMLRRCQQRICHLNARARARIHIIQGDFRHLPLSNGRSTGFPLILCPFNGFNHLYTREDAERFLAEVRRLLGPGGLFAFDIVNPDPAWLARTPARRFARTRFRHPTTGERLIYSTNHAYDPATQIVWMRLYYEPDPAEASTLSLKEPTASTLKGTAQRPLGPMPASEPATISDTVVDTNRGPSRTVTLAHRLYFPAEIEALLHYNGFEIVHHAGGFPTHGAKREESLDGIPLSIVSAEQVICARVR